jgi:tRNA pseudouridine38-40 synthase
MKVAIDLSYSGVNYLGSQIQKETPQTVFGVVTTILKQLGIDSTPVASGRTDKGVHALSQVAHFTLPPHWQKKDSLRTTINQMLPDDIYLKSLKIVEEDFHARYSAKKRSYRYIIKTSQKNPFQTNFVTFLQKCDFRSIQQNISLFEGEHDFINFMKTGSDTKSSIRTIYKAFVYKHKEYIILNFEANGFLRSQIRLMVGALLQLSASEIQEQLNNTHKYKIRPAPPNGLYLHKIKY